MSFSFVCYPLLLFVASLAISVLYFATGRGCFMVLSVLLSAFGVDLHIWRCYCLCFTTALRQFTAMSYNTAMGYTTALRQFAAMSYITAMGYTLPWLYHGDYLL